VLAQPLTSKIHLPLKGGPSNRKRNSEKANNEFRTRNNEYRSKVFYQYFFSKKTERSDSILRHSAVRYSIFCGSLLTFHKRCWVALQLGTLNLEPFNLWRFIA
jgi:hypothetical protein